MITFSSSYQQSKSQALSHLSDFLLMPIDIAIHNIRSNAGSFTGSLASLTLNAECMAMLAYFRDHDVELLQKWSWMAAKIDQALLKRKWHDNYFVGDFLWATLSGDDELIGWFSKPEIYSRDQSLKQREDPSKYPFFSYQVCLALRGEWQALEERASKVVENPELLKQNSFLLCEHRFFLSLAQGELKEMEKAIIEMISTKQRKRSFSTRNALVKGFMEPHALLYTKIARRHGYSLNIDSPWVPSELVMTDPIGEHSDLWGILPFLEG